MSEISNIQIEELNLGLKDNVARGQIVEVNKNIGGIEKNLNDIGININQFGGGVEVLDNHNAIMNALAYAKENKISNIILPFGEIKTSPIKMEGYSHITLQGSASSYYPDETGQHGTTLKIVASGEVAIQLNSKTDIEGKRTWFTMSNTLKDIKIDCNNNTRIGVNARFDITLENVYIINAIEDGIVIESGSYPVKLNNVFSSYNGRHGLYVKSPLTTVYYVTNSEFSRNDGYGIIVEGGANSKFENIIIQSNKCGGIKVNYPNESMFSDEVYVQNITFDNIYTEYNGLLLDTDNKYDGNWAFKVSSDTVNKQPYNVKITNSSIFQSQNGGSLFIDKCYQIYIDSNTSSDAKINVGSKVRGVEFSRKIDEVTSNISPSGGNIFKSYYTDNVSGVGFSGGIFPSRGRTFIINYYLDSLSNWGTSHAICSLTLPTGVQLAGYPLLKNGSILYITIEKVGRAQSSGNVIITPEISNSLDDENWVQLKDSTGANISYNWLLQSSNNFQRMHSPNTVPFSSGNRLRFKFSSQGHSIGETDGYFISVMVEY